MAPSLKERYDQRQLQQLREHTRAVDEQLLTEQTTAKLLVEKLDAQDLEKVSAIIQKLDAIKTPELPHLTQAIEQAQAELNKYTGGGPLAQAWSKLQGLAGIDNPVVKITTFADALERGMAQIPTILKNNGVDLAKADLNKSLATTLQSAPPTGSTGGPGGMKDNPTDTGNAAKKAPQQPKPQTGAKSDEDLANTRFDNNSGQKEDLNASRKLSTAAPVAKKTGGQDQPPKPKPGIRPKPPVKTSSAAADEGHDIKEDDEAPTFATQDSGKKPMMGDQKLKNITAQIRKALAPGGIFGAFKKLPYVNGDALAKELVAAPIKVFANTAKRVQQGAKAAEVAPDMKDVAQGQGAAQTKHSGAAQPTAPAGQSQPSQPDKPTTATTDTTGTGEKTPAAPGTARGGGAAVNNKQEKPAAKVQNFQAGLKKIYDGAGVDEDNGKKLLKYLLSNNIIDRSTIESHGTSGSAAQKPSAA